MGLFDKWGAVFRGASGKHKVQPKKYYDTDEAQFVADIPEGEAFVAVSADRFISKGQKGTSDEEKLMDTLRRIITSVSNSWCQHAFIGIKKDGVVYIVESLKKITIAKLDVYFEKKNQIKLFFPPITKDHSAIVWERGCSRKGEEYDYPELYDKVSIFSWFGIRFGNKKKTVCHEFARWAFQPFYDVFNPKIKYRNTYPGSINNWLRNKPGVKLMCYNLDQNIHN